MDPFWRFTQQSALSPPALAAAIVFAALVSGQNVRGCQNTQDKVTAESKKPIGERALGLVAAYKPDITGIL